AHLGGVYLDPDFPEALVRYTAAFAARYRGVVGKLTPWNEPYISTYFRAGWGIWPPHLRGREGFARLLRPLVSGLHGAIKAVNQSAPEMRIWLNDGADSFHPLRREVAAEAEFRTLQRYAAFDLLSGLAVPGQETHEWLVAAGFAAAELATLTADPVTIDVIGLDYYPETEHDFDLDADGQPVITNATEPVGL